MLTTAHVLLRCSPRVPYNNVVGVKKSWTDYFNQMAAPGYADKVPENVRESNSKKKGEYEAQKESVLKAMQQFEGLKI